MMSPASTRLAPVAASTSARSAFFEPRVIMVTPSYFLAILDELDRQRLRMEQDLSEATAEVGRLEHGAHIMPIMDNLNLDSVAETDAQFADARAGTS